MEFFPQLKIYTFISGSHCQFAIFCVKPFEKYFEICLWLNRLRPAPSSHWGCWLVQLIVGMRDSRMHRCVVRTIAKLILDFMNLKFGKDFPDLPGCVVLLYLGVISKHSITWNHKGREVTALVQTGLELFLLFCTIIGIPSSDVYKDLFSTAAISWQNST